MRYLIIVLFVIYGCAKEKIVSVAYPEKTPITDRIVIETELPVYQAPSENVQAADMAKGDPAPFDGILIDEQAALNAGALRVNYDEIYQIAQVDRKFMTTVVQIEEQELYRSQKMIELREAELKELRDSWWERNKLMVGIGVGILGGAGLTLAAGVIWAQIEEEKVGP